MTTKRVIYDTSAILSSMTPVPNQGSTIWHWMQSHITQVVVSDYLVQELITKLEEPRFRLSPEQQDSVIAEYLHHALLFTRVPESGAHCRDPQDVPVLDLAIWQSVDAIITTDPDRLELDGEFKFRIVTPGGFQELVTNEQLQVGHGNGLKSGRPVRPFASVLRLIF